MSRALHWTFLSNHAHVLVCIARDEHIRVREIAELVGVTERAVQRILKELEDANVIAREREGRRTLYSINDSVSLRHPSESTHTVAELLETLSSEQQAVAV